MPDDDRLPPLDVLLPLFSVTVEDTALLPAPADAREEVDVAPPTPPPGDAFGGWLRFSLALASCRANELISAGFADSMFAPGGGGGGGGAAALLIFGGMGGAGGCGIFDGADMGNIGGIIGGGGGAATLLCCICGGGCCCCIGIGIWGTGGTPYWGCPTPYGPPPPTIPTPFGGP